MKSITKHKLLLHFIDTADNNCESRYYFDPTLSEIPKGLLNALIDELAAEGYLTRRVRAVHLKPKAFSYKRDRRIKFFSKAASILGRPVSYLITWVLGILSSLLIQYLINVLNLNS